MRQRFAAILPHLPALAGLLLGAAIWGGLSIGVPEWSWRHRPQLVVAPWRALLPAIVLLAVALLFARAAQSGRRLALALILLLLACWFLQLGLAATATDLAVSSDPVIYSLGVIASPVATTYFSLAIGEGDVGRLLREYPRAMPRLPLHARTHPPGPVIFFHSASWLVQRLPLLRRALETALAALTGFSSDQVARHLDRAFARYAGLFHEYRPDFGLRYDSARVLAALLSGCLLALCGSLSLLPIWALARLRYGDQVGWWAAVLFALVPSLSLFAVAIDQLLLLFSALSLYLAYAGWRRGPPLLAAAAGVAFIGALLVSFAALALIPLLLIWAALGLLRSAPGERRAARLLPLLGFALAGAAAAAGAFLLLTGCNLLTLIAAGLSAHRGALAYPRSYWVWALFDPVEFAAFLGLPLALWVLVSLFSGSTQVRTGDSLLLAWLITFLGLDLCGLVRGEVGRIWLFLMFPPAIGAADLLCRKVRLPAAGFLLLLAALFFQTYQMKANLGLFSLF
jgi:hypothetical protein